MLHLNGIFHLLITLMLAVAGFSGAAHADSHCASLLDGEAGCTCALPLDEFDPETTAVLSDISGNVEVTTSNQFSPADPTVPIDVGDSAIVLEDSSALLTFGPTCSRQLPAHSSLVIRAVEGCACATLAAAQTQADSDDDEPNPPLLVGTALAIGPVLATYILTQVDDDDDDDPVSPE